MQNRMKTVLESDHVGRLLMKLTVPIFFGMFVQMIYNVVDMIFIGRYVGPMAIAGVSVVFPINMLTIGIGTMVGVGGASLISRLIGQGDKSGAERALGNGMTFSVIFSLLLMALILPNVNFWLKLIGASPDVLPFARDYLIIVQAGTIVNIVSSVLMTYIRSEGNARVTMITMMTGAVLNIGLDALFIIALDMGVKGAALATIISQSVALIYLLSYYLTKSGYLKVHVSNFAPDWKILKSIFAIGVASFAQTLVTAVAATLIIKMAVTYGGDMALSTFGIIQRTLWFAMMPGMVIGQGMQPVLGYNYGARRFNLALRSIILASIAATALSTVAFLVLILKPDAIAGIFTTDAGLIAAASYAAKRIFIALPLVGFFNVGSTVFPSIGKAIGSFIVAIARPLLFIIPAVLILPRFMGLDGVWYSFALSDALTFLLTIALVVPLIRSFQKSHEAEQELKLASLSQLAEVKKNGD
jgi:putative MATE family efflux protein